jgi:hypothetical protein
MTIVATIIKVKNDNDNGNCKIDKNYKNDNN